MPAFPDSTLEANTTGLSGETTLRQAFEFYLDVSRGVASAGESLLPHWKVLDFGVGWGRILRTFLRDVALENMYGLDVDDSFIQLCRSLFPAGAFHTCAPFPPTSLQSGSLNLVTAYSVFSHLSERACLSWVEEFARLLAPAGFFAFTTRHPSFFDYMDKAKADTTATGYTAALGQLFRDIADARARYGRGELVHATSRGVSGGGPRNESFYGETFIPSRYVQYRFSEWFTVVGEYFDGRRYDQQCFVLQRR